MNLISKLGVRSFRAFSLLFALSFVASAQAIEPSGPDAAVMEKLIKTLLNNLHQGNFEEASRLFRYPETYTKDELAVDQENVATSLRVAAEHLGQVRRAKQLREKRAYVSVATGGGNLSYWEANPNYATLYLEVTYSIVGNGYLIINLVPTDGEWKLRSLEYALDSDGESVQALKSVSDAWLAIMQKRSGE